MKGPIAVTSYGELQGTHDSGVNIWRGIPFAAPPVGKLRFRAPQPPAFWSGVRDASEFGPVSHQPEDTRGTRFGGVQPLCSEDCLYLNIWSPAEDGTGLPVMVWIHGGTFVTGAGSQPLFDGASLVTQGNVIVVSINYRLGPFGFLHLSPQGDGLTSNQGLLDQIAALKWVQGNIAAFGGDPSRVTVFGESAGSMSIAALLAMPAAQGLFAGAIMQSGAAQTLQTEQGEDIAAALLAELGIRPGGDTAALATLPAEHIMEAAARMTYKLTGGSLSMFFQPVIDPGTLPEDPARAVAGGTAAGIPLLIGTNRHEGNLFFREGTAGADFEQSLKALELLMGTGSLAEIASHYPSSWEGQAEILTDLYFWSSSVSFAENQQAHAPVWMYRFDWAVPGHPLLSKAVHGAEIVYVFNNLSLLPRLGLQITPPMRRLAEEMQQAWIAFAYRGNPGTPQLAWPEYTPEERATLIFDENAHVVFDPDPEKRKRLNVWTENESPAVPLQTHRDHLIRLFDHVHWANKEILKVLQRVDSVPQKLISLFGHLLSAEKVWLERLNQRDSSSLNIWPLTRLEDCEVLAQENYSGYRSFLSQLSDADLPAKVSYYNSKGILFHTSKLDILSHVPLHGSYHRGQISSYLRLEGYEPVNTDYINFSRLSEDEGTGL